MPDALFADPRLVAVYDALDGDRDDLEVHAALVDELGARSVLDVGCGTGTFASLLATRGLEVTGVEPAAASLDVARTKPGADRVTWVLGAGADLPAVRVDAVTMTANVAQVFLTDEEWTAALRAAYGVLAPGGHLVLEIRVPERRAWEEWDRAHTHRFLDVPGTGDVETWCDVTAVDGDLVSFRWTFVLGDGEVLVSESTLRFRSRGEVEAALAGAGFTGVEVRDAPDRPGREWVFVARRP